MKVAQVVGALAAVTLSAGPSVETSPWHVGAIEKPQPRQAYGRGERS